MVKPTVDQQMKQARVKCSFELLSYCFSKENDALINGTKSQLRKLQILQTMDFSTLINHECEDAIGGDVIGDFYVSPSTARRYYLA